MKDNTQATGLIGGVEKTHIEIVAYHPDWPHKFQTEYRRAAADHRSPKATVLSGRMPSTSDEPFASWPHDCAGRRTLSALHHRRTTADAARIPNIRGADLENRP